MEIVQNKIFKDALYNNPFKTKILFNNRTSDPYFVIFKSDLKYCINP